MAGSNDTKFRAIIVGAGPIGLTLANMLQRAGLDFIMLERHHTVVADSGACIMLWPHSSRVFDQLGLYDASMAAYMPLTDYTKHDYRGNVRADYSFFTYLEESAGYPAMNFPRYKLTRVLYDGIGGEKLEKQGKVRTGVTIKGVEEDADGVTVSLEDGSTVKGSIVVGCDGVHSQVRDLMRAAARKLQDDKTGTAIKPEEEDEDARTTYLCLYGRATIPKGMKLGCFTESHGNDVASQCGGDPKTGVHFGVFRKLPQGTTAPGARHTFTKEEERQYVEELGHVPMAYEHEHGGQVGEAAGKRTNRPITLKDFYENNCTWTKLVYQPEGMAKTWFRGRMVLCGDSAVQMTSTAGMGLNIGIQSAVFLANKLRETVVVSSEEQRNPSLETLTNEVFAPYQETRFRESQAISKMAADVIRMAAWSSWSNWIWGEYIMPWLTSGRDAVTRMTSMLVAPARKLDYVPFNEKTGSVPWVN